jgi:4-hydroxybenzoate polyprenyltransferase
MSGALFVAFCFLINRVCFLLSPLALGLITLYSFTKRWTDWSHLVLGLALGISPPAAWIAVTGTLSLEPVLLGLAVLFWVAGFDVIYATQDYEFDRKEGLHSLVARFGIARALWISRAFHGFALAFLLLFGQSASLGWIYKLTIALIGILFLYEHSLVRPQDLSRVNAAFFNVNGYISLLFLAGVTLSV